MYGRQLNIFRSKAEKYGPDWKGLVLCSNAHELKLAAEDAVNMTGGRYYAAMRLLKTGNGATLRFQIATTPQETQRACVGLQFTQLIWLHKPEQAEMADTTFASMRSRNVPKDDWRHEYCHAY